MGGNDESPYIDNDGLAATSETQHTDKKAYSSDCIRSKPHSNMWLVAYKSWEQSSLLTDDAV
jgi:hypothetical protein